VSGENGDRKTARELRQALASNRAQIEADLSTMESRVSENLNPLNVVRRHPVLMAGAGAVLGVFIVRRPAMFARALGQIAGWGAPMLFSALVKGVGLGPGARPPTETEPTENA
jgi:hypothetical protein